VYWKSGGRVGRGLRPISGRMSGRSRSKVVRCCAAQGVVKCVKEQLHVKLASGDAACIIGEGGGNLI